MGGNSTYSVVRLPDGRESTVSSSDLAPCPPAHNDSTDPPTTDSSLPESDGVGGDDLGDVPADEADSVRSEGQNDESSVPEDIVSDTKPALPRRSTRSRKTPDRYGFNVASIWTGVIVEMRVLLPRRFNLFIRGTLIAATGARGSWRLYFTASVERAFLLSLLRVIDTALCFCRW